MTHEHHGMSQFVSNTEAAKTARRDASNERKDGKGENEDSTQKAEVDKDEEVEQTEDVMDFKEEKEPQKTNKRSKSDEDDIDEMDIEVPGWDTKGQWILFLDLFAGEFECSL